MTAHKDDLNAFGELCASQHERLSKFREEYPDLEVVFGAALNAGNLAVGSISLICGMTTVESLRWVMWQTVFEYQKQSLLLIVGAHTDAGLALIRLAAELARGVAVIRDDAERLDLWARRRDPARQREYRRIFRFDDETSAGKMAHQVYDLCSEFGVHGHDSDVMHLEPLGKFSASGRDKLLMMKVSDSGVLSALQIWLAAFVPLHLLCFEAFVAKHQRTLAEPHQHFVGLTEVLGPVLKAIDRRLRKLGPKPN
jgi:hypothetical protein